MKTIVEARCDLGQKLGAAFVGSLFLFFGGGLMTGLLKTRETPGEFWWWAALAICFFFGVWLPLATFTFSLRADENGVMQRVGPFTQRASWRDIAHYKWELTNTRPAVSEPSLLNAQGDTIFRAWSAIFISFGGANEERSRFLQYVTSKIDEKNENAIFVV